MSLEIKTKPDDTGMYETTFVAVPELSEAEHKKLSSKIEKLIKDNGGKIINVEQWGVMKFAYPINRHHSGYYTYIEFSAPTSFITKLKKEYGYDETIIRELTVSLDKHAIEYNKRRRNKEFATQKGGATANAEEGEAKSPARRRKTLANEEA